MLCLQGKFYEIIHFYKEFKMLHNKILVIYIERSKRNLNSNKWLKYFNYLKVKNFKIHLKPLSFSKLKLYFLT